MSRLGFLLALATLSAVAITSCSGPSKQVKHAKKDDKRAEKSLLAKARDLTKDNDYDAADKAYADAYAASKDFHAGRATKAVEAAKPYWEANGTEVKGYNLYAEALLAANKGGEALDVANSIIGFHENDPSGHEKKGRALLLIDKTEEGLDELHKAVSLDGNNSSLHISLGNALIKAQKVDEAALEFRAAIKFAADDPDAKVLLAHAKRIRRGEGLSRQGDRARPA
jgi:Flp pilus assembly protein TadD